MIKTPIKWMLEKAGFRLQRIPPSHYRPHPIQPWEEQAEFRKLLSEIEQHTLLDKTASFMLYQMANQALNLPGDFAEIGVYRGGTARLLAKIAAKAGKKVHLFDTFEGMPETDPQRDKHQEGDFRDTSLKAVKDFLRDCPNVEFYPGFFPDTAGPIKGINFSLVHVDVDIYQSVKDCCEFFHDRLVQGGVMLFDDYGSTYCPGAKQAVDEYFESTQENPCYLWTGQAMVSKIPRA